MIKVTTQRGETDLSIIGDLSDVCADTVSIVAAVRKSLAEHDPRIAELYEKAMKAKLINLAFGPESDKEEAKTEGKDAETGKDAEAKVDDFMEKLVDLIGELLK